MPTVDEQLIAMLSKEVAPQQTSGMEQAPAIETEAPAEAPVMEAAAPSEQPPAVEATPPAETFDPNKWIEEFTGGTFKDAEAFKQSLPKLTDYDKIKTERDTFEAKTKQNPFASDYVRILDELVRGGATADQLNNFQKINAIGDINAMSPIDAKVAKLVLIDGYKESVARKMVEKDYPVGDYEDGSDDKEILEEKLRVDANADKLTLAKYKAETSTVKNPQEDNQLQQLAQRKQHEQQVKAAVPQLASQIKGMGEIPFKDKDGKEQGKLKFDYPDEFKQTISQKLEQYFMDGTTPINNDTIQEAVKMVNAVYLDENFPVLSQRIWDSAYAKAWEDATNKYENRSGLPQSPEIQVNPGDNAAKEYAAFQKRLVGQ